MNLYNPIVSHITSQISCLTMMIIWPKKLPLLLLFSLAMTRPSPDRLNHLHYVEQGQWHLHFQLWSSDCETFPETGTNSIPRPLVDQAFCDAYNVTLSCPLLQQYCILCIPTPPFLLQAKVKIKFGEFLEGERRQPVRILGPLGKQ